MNLTRRNFSALAATAAVSCVCAESQAATTTASTTAATTEASQPPPPPAVIDAGPLTAFGKDDVYDALRMKGAFIIRRDEKLFALSSICTHKGCKVRVQDDLSFLCKCHGSRYDKDGHVTHGPAKKNLARLAIAVDAKQHVLVNTGMELASTRP